MKKRNLFSERVIKIALSIPKGRVTTYGRISRAAGGGTMASQSITTILWKAEQRGVKNIPYHRIVYGDGRVWMNPEYRRFHEGRARPFAPVPRRRACVNGGDFARTLRSARDPWQAYLSLPLWFWGFDSSRVHHRVDKRAVKGYSIAVANSGLCSLGPEPTKAPRTGSFRLH
jgi:alkylated DNA nucleotide flippase Atl1